MAGGGVREIDPNSQATDPLDFTISGIKGEKLTLATLKGKVIVMDFWATWCGPCRAQHPLYAEVKKKFAGDGALPGREQLGQVSLFRGWHGHRPPHLLNFHRHDPEQEKARS